MQIFDLLSQSPLGAAMRDVPSLFPTMEIVHFVGLSLLLGGMLVVDLRILGLFRTIPYADAFKLLRLAIVGFALSALSGVAFLASNPDLYTTNVAFYLKMALVALAGLNALWFTLSHSRAVSELAPNQRAPAPARAIAAASLALWTAVIVLGRLLPTFAAVGGG